MLSDNIRKYRKLNNMSQDELAEKLSVTRQSISLWENGQTQPSLENIVALAKLFQVSTDELLVSDKTAIPSAPPTTDPQPNDPKNNNNKTKIIFIALGAVIVIALLIVTLAILGSCGDSDNNNKDNSSAITDDDENDAPEADTENNETDKPAADTDNNVNDNTEEETVEEEKDIFGYLKSFAIENGIINGDYCYYSKSADNYGGYASENFSLYYWGDTNKVEFCLHSVIDETFSINFYIYVPEEHSGEYEYISSYYYRDNGEALYEAKGKISAKDFTDNYPLNCTKYIGSTEKQNTFMELSRQGICDLLDCLEKFIEVEEIKYSFKEDFGFLKFNLDRD